tara:strand:+ start:1939 stop:3270 length:1332 start_codon:yes stop_codon:yes gene_type:complete
LEITLYEELDSSILEKQYSGCNHIHLSNNPQPDWADLLAAKWLKAIKKTYKDKGLDSFKFSQDIVTAQANQFVAAVDQQFNSNIDFDTPDYKMREVLKQNTWHFSIAKNHNDLKSLNNLLLKTDGSLRSWNEFKNEAQKVVGTSIKYLKTEYDTIVAGAQMSSLWAEIQRDKHIFPFLEFVVTKDNRTSAICEPLYKVVVSVDDPMLMYYFPPNHFNCRTTVKKLRRGVPTQNYAAPEIPEAFRNNIGVTGKLFTDKNEYLKNTPQEILDLGTEMFYRNKRAERYKKIAFIKSVIKGKGSLEIFATGNQSKVEYIKNKEALTILANNNQKYRLLPIINDGAKNPDGFNLITNKYVDVKVAESIIGKNIIAAALKEASRQNAEEVIIRLLYKPNSYREMYTALLNVLKKNRNKNVTDVIVIFPDNTFKKYILDRELLKIKKAQI